MLSCTDNVEKFDTIVHSSTTLERNLELLRIKEVGVKSIFPELRNEPEPSVRVNLAKSVLRKIPRFINIGHLTVETADIRNLDYISANRANNCNRLRRGTEKDDRLGYTHDFETMSALSS